MSRAPKFIISASLLLGLAVFAGVYRGPVSQPQNIQATVSAPTESSLVSSFGGATSKFGPWSASLDLLNPVHQFFKHRVERGETLSHLWQAYGASRESALLAAKALKDSKESNQLLRHGEEIELTVAPDGEISEVRRRLTEGKTLILTRNGESGYETRMIASPIIESERTVVGTIQSSFAATAASSGIPYDVVDDFVDLFGGRVEFHRSLQPGDTFVVQYTERMTEDGETLCPGAIRAASLATGGKQLSSIRYIGSDQKPRYFDERGEALGSYFLRYPVKFTRISSAFSESRFHPILKVNRPHNGVDFAAPSGTPVRAVADGVIELASYSGGGGLTVKIRHDSRWSTAYLHLSKITGGLRPGSRVSRGEVIGAVGSTGLSTAPHLHFSLYDRARYVNPLTAALPQVTTGERIPKDYLMAALNALNLAQEQHQLAQAVGADEPKA